MIVKLIASVVLVATTSFIGFLLARDYSKRPKALRELQSLLQMLENEISYLSNLLSDAFNRIYKGANCETSILFKEAAECLSTKGINADTAWERAVQKNYLKLSLNNEDKAILLSFGKMLGNSNVEGQLSNIRLTSSQLKLQELKAEEMRQKNEKMYRSLGILSGLAISVILF